MTCTRPLAASLLQVSLLAVPTYILCVLAFCACSVLAMFSCAINYKLSN